MRTAQITHIARRSTVWVMSAMWLAAMALHAGRASTNTVQPAAAVTNDSAAAAPAFMLDEDTMRSIVTITGSRGAGTGFIASHNGKIYLFSNVHVLMGNANMRFLNNRGEAFYPVAMEAASDRDVVRLTLRTPPRHSLKIDTPGAVNVPVAVCGNAEGEDVMRSVGGTIVGVGPIKIETDAQFVRGHSGSPILTSDGRVLGIATYVKRGNPDWVSTNTPFSVTRRFGYRLDNIKSWIKVDPAWFKSEAEFLRQREEKLYQLTALLDIWAEDPYWQQLPEDYTSVLHRGMMDWVRAHNERIASNQRRLLSARASHSKAAELSREFHEQLRQDAEVLKREMHVMWQGPRPRWHLAFFKDYAADLDAWHSTLLKAVDHLVLLHASYNPVVVKQRTQP